MSDKIDLHDERVLRRFEGERSPSLKSEFTDLTMSQRLDVLLELKRCVDRERYGGDPPFERVLKVIRLDEK